MKKICIFQKKAVPLHPLLEKCPIFNLQFAMRTQFAHGGHSSVGRASDCGSECRGFEPHSPPQKRVIRLSFFVFIHARVHAFLLYILYENARFTRFHRVEYTYFPLFPLFPQKIAKNQSLIIRHLQRKCIFFEIFLQKYLVNSKICCTFASAFAQKTGNPQEREQ